MHTAWRYVQKNLFHDFILHFQCSNSWRSGYTLKLHRDLSLFEFDESCLAWVETKGRCHFWGYMRFFWTHISLSVPFWLEDTELLHDVNFRCFLLLCVTLRIFSRMCPYLTMQYLALRPTFRGGLQQDFLRRLCSKMTLQSSWLVQMHVERLKQPVMCT